MTRTPVPDGSSGGPPPAHARRRALWGLLFLAGYVLPLFVPPGPHPLLPPAADAALLERLFPTVPAWWMVARLACLVVGAVLIAGAVDRPAPVRLSRVTRGTASRSPGPSRNVIVAALVVAIVLAALSLRVAQFSGAQQVAYFAALGVPAMLLWLSTRWRAFRAASGASLARPRSRRAALAVVLVLAVWCGLRIPAALHSPRAATPIDFWLNFQWLSEIVAQNSNILTSSSEPGVPNTYMLFVGAPLLEAAKLAPSLTWVQGCHVVWILGTALALALLVSLTVSRVAAPVAVASFLFSPVLLMLHLVPAPFGLMTLLTVALLLLTRQLYVEPSVTGLAALGALAGVSATLPHLMHFAAIAILAATIRALRRPRLPWAGVVIAAATFLAATVPAVPSLATLREMREKYVQMNRQWAGLEAVLLGQRSPRRKPDIAAILWAGRGAPYDVTLSGVLMPFAVPRTGLRLCGDTLFEPIGAALAAVGLAACVRRPTRRGAAAALAFYGLTLLPVAATRSDDRVSMTRSIGTPVAVALLAAVGFETLRRALLNRRRAPRAGAATVAISILSGVVLFDAVIPRLIPSSSLDIIMQAVRQVPNPSRVTVLAQVEPYKPYGWLHVERIATYLPAKPLATWTFEQPEHVLPAADEPAPDLFAWSPGLEEDAQASRAICARWPGAALYSLQDRAALSRAFAASPSGAHWRPALPAEQWSVGDCATLAGQLQGRY